MDVHKVLHKAAKQLLKATLPAKVRTDNQIIKSKKQIKINIEKALKDASIVAAETSIAVGLNGKSQKAAHTGVVKIKKSHFTKGADSIG